MTDSIRVAMVIHNYYPTIGGAERVLTALSPELKKNNIDIHILTRRLPGTAAFERISGIPVYRLSATGPKQFASLSFTLSALRRIRKLRPDIVHSHIMFSPATIGLIARWLFRTGFVITVHRSGPAPLGETERLKQLFLGKFRLSLFRKYAEKFIAVSREIDTELAAAGIPESRRILIPNAVDADYFYPLSPDDKRALRERLGIHSDRIAVYTGRLRPEKQVHLLISAWQKIQKSYPDALLLIVGEGPLYEKLKNQVREGIIFTGGVSSVLPYLQAADIFVLPSAAEGLSIAMLEAMSSALPAIVTDIAGAKDVITHKKNGWLVRPGDVEELQQGLIALFGDEALRNKIGKEAREHIRQNYSLNAVEKQLRNLYLRIVQEKSDITN